MHENDQQKQKEIWAKEKEQLKKDLATRGKVVKKREVAIKFGGKAKKAAPTAPTPQVDKSAFSKENDDVMRQRLGL
jgi:hypothetical protein